MTPPLTLARQAMATRFEIALHGDNPISLRAAGEEAFDEIERIEDRLSLYRPTSEIAHVNARAAREAVRVSPATFRLLKHAVNLSAETGGERYFRNTRRIRHYYRSAHALLGVRGRHRSDADSRSPRRSPRENRNEPR